MTDTLLSPGTLTRLQDNTSIAQGAVTVGAAVIGPTPKGPVIPTVVTSYPEYAARYGTTFLSGGIQYSYMTSLTAFNYFADGGTSLLVQRVTPTDFTAATSSVASGFGATTASFELETLAVGANQNNANGELSTGYLPSGSKDNIRWEVLTPNTASGTFTLLVRSGDDTTAQKNILETWTNLSLDPFSTNYIERVIGNQVNTIVTDSSTGGIYVRPLGDYPNISKYVRVKSVKLPTPGYLDPNGNLTVSSYTSSLPIAGSGSMGGAVGVMFGNGAAFYNNITSATNVQGLDASRYTASISLLSNREEYAYKNIVTPGLTLQQGGTSAVAINTLLEVVRDRGDSVYVPDLVNFGAEIGTVVSQAASIDNIAGTAYYSWQQIQDPDTGRYVWIPMSVLMPGVFAASDKMSEPWWSPAGLSRGRLSRVIQSERKLKPSDRDILYQANVNPVSTFPGRGIAIWGNKTLQKKSTALTSLNVYRLMIECRTLIGDIGNSLVFDQNDGALRASFLNRSRPVLESIKLRRGLYHYEIIMDDSNNNGTTIDRLEVYGRIKLYPVKSAEYVYLDFTAENTGITVTGQGVGQG